ncbi:MAG: alpha/beta-hydrolase family protein [Corynebacterium flavescens]|uniref:alpha/beta-hydrolase family protein n=1 Tax=Corynebacterium flavescens TaxID=28028 RepID=UPI002649B2CD|nr:alpha/beta-hydrolase family protein [Corynebacterium flavescens]MDN6553157.1 alpha/beta-hydrolase family protein [Corynebacterium flavescens]
MALMHSLARKVLIKALSSALFGLEVLSDLTPGLRMTGRRRLPRNMSAGILGAEVATWAAISPSLLPRPWWVTAANVSIGQGIGYLGATAAAFSLKRFLRAVGKRPQDHVSARYRRGAHLILGAGTVIFAGLSLRNQRRQAALVGRDLVRGPATAAVGLAVGTAGYGGLLLLGELTQVTISSISRRLGSWIPAGIAWPLVAGGLALSSVAFSDRVVLRRWLRSVALDAQRINRRIFPGTMMPWEPERSGSPWSHERWTALGQQGRRFVSNGPRAHTIKEVMGFDHAHEPIRIYAGLVPGRSVYQSAQRVISEMERTGAFRRDIIVILMPAGSGWVNNWGVSGYEFLTRGNCVTVSMQYSYAPSVFSYVIDKNAPKLAARTLIAAIREAMESLPATDRPRLYLGGESLGAYAILDNYRDLDELLADCNGAVFTGPPSMTRFNQRLNRDRDPGSLERLPVIDGGRHVRFVSTPDHTLYDAFGTKYAHTWRRPRIIMAQHASDAIVWWNPKLIFSPPHWMREPQPPTLHADTLRRLVWAPLITFWQIGLDQINSLNVPGGHGHNYFEETFWYWDAVLGSQSQVRLTQQLAARMTHYLRRTQF